MSDEAIQRFVLATAEDKVLQEVIKFVNTEWPTNLKNYSETVRRYATFSEELSTVEGLLYKGEKVVVPDKEIPNTLKIVHSGHPGIGSAIRRARQFLFWPNQSKQIYDFVEKCSVCQQTQRANKKEEIFETETPKYPFELVSTDLFQFEGMDYIVIADSYSGFLDLKKLKSPNTYYVIDTLKS